MASSYLNDSTRQSEDERHPRPAWVDGAGHIPANPTHVRVAPADIEAATDKALDGVLAAAANLAAALRLFLGAAYPVSTDIDPRGYRWSEAYLDQARAAALAITTPAGVNAQADARSV